MSFPFHQHFEGTPVYLRTCQILEELAGIRPEELPRQQEKVVTGRVPQFVARQIPS
jgi:hypothetical protein